MHCDRSSSHRSLPPYCNVSRPHRLLLYMGKNLTIFNVSIEGSPNWTSS
jgi:hypothetical protein